MFYSPLIEVGVLSTFKINNTQHALDVMKFFLTSIYYTTKIVFVHFYFTVTVTALAYPFLAYTYIFVVPLLLPVITPFDDTVAIALFAD